MRAISILGSTGSVGCSTLEVVDSFPEELRVAAIAARSNIDLLMEQARKYRPSLVAIQDESLAPELRTRLAGSGIEVVAGQEGTIAVATYPASSAVVAAIVGAAGIAPVHAALASGKRVALANKEVLVAAGSIMMEAARQSGGEILPVDSEHNAVHQALRAGTIDEVERIILTASGGPFLQRDLLTFGEVTVAEALAHPTWRMGSKISIDSATMMNKGLEVIEAHHLFGLEAGKIDIVIHPQSIVHSFVEFVDGSFVAQLSTADMKLPIQYSLLYPGRSRAPFARLDLSKIRQLDFLPVDSRRFPAVALAYEACRIGGSMPAVMNAANEVAVERFLAREIPFNAIAEVVRIVMEQHQGKGTPLASLDDVLSWDSWGRNAAASVPVRFCQPA